jgi:protein TonB
MAIVGGVGLLHVVAIYALIAGMKPGVVTQIEQEIHLVPVARTEQPPVQAPPQVKLVQPVAPTTPTITPPDVPIQSPTPSPIYIAPTPTNPAPAVPDSSATGLTNTHTTPPYPVEARDQSHSGSVLLQLIVSAQGDVTSANVVTSSGHAELDQAAVSWVVAHWKYKPAVQNGIAVPSQTQAIVKFDLKQAGH